MPARRPRAAVLAVLLLASAAGLAACGPGGSDDAATTPTPAHTPAPTPSPTPTPTPTPTGAALPTVRLDAGAVADGAAAAVSGEGPALVSVRREGELGVVAHLDCSACTGEVVVTAEGRGDPWGAGTAPLSGSYLVDVFRDSEPKQTLVVQAQGPWTMRLESWNDLPPVTGVQQGSGSTVLLVGDTASAVRVDYTPAGPGDDLLARVFSAVEVEDTWSPASLLFGDDVAFSETADVPMPGIVALSTNGSWTVTPVP
ncbi:hypothetical protein [Cellulomonas hominis]|uniref:hypothetical protein n=1 Tax=Cellulomonas hominis TaxID=156981 RepID=UPI001BCB088C|nr:hypothetical protein [Cellulomonas hominis]